VSGTSRDSVHTNSTSSRPKPYWPRLTPPVKCRCDTPNATWKAYILATLKANGVSYEPL